MSGSLLSEELPDRRRSVCVGQTRRVRLCAAALMQGVPGRAQAYAAAFFAIPALRWLLNARRNAQIEARNAARLAALTALRAPNARLRRKLANAARQAQRVVIADRDIVYSSDKWVAALVQPGISSLPFVLHRKKGLLPMCIVRLIASRLYSGIQSC